MGSTKMDGDKDQPDGTHYAYRQQLLRFSFTTNVAVDPLAPVLRSTGVNKRMWYDHKARR